MSLAHIEAIIRIFAPASLRPYRAVWIIGGENPCAAMKASGNQLAKGDGLYMTSYSIST
jgi:hypothetical protein